MVRIQNMQMYTRSQSKLFHSKGMPKKALFRFQKELARLFNIQALAQAL